MTCRGFQYEIGKTYETDEADLCNSGFHACENPLDCFKYYSPAKSKYFEVEIEDNGQRHTDDSKVVGKKIKIGAELSVAQICKIHFDYVKKRCIPTRSTVAGDRESASAGEYGIASAGKCGSASAGEYGIASAGYGGSASAGKCGSASAGKCGSASAGEYGSASAGYGGSASAGEYGGASAGKCGSASAGYGGSASAGEYGIASAGDGGSASAGDGGNASAGEYGSASAGYGGSASAGWYGVSASRGSADVGGNGVAVVRGYDVKAKGGIGSVLVVAIENENDNNIKEWKAAVVDGVTVKADTYYTLKNGVFAEAQK